MSQSLEWSSNGKEYRAQCTHGECLISRSETGSWRFVVKKKGKIVAQGFSPFVYRAQLGAQSAALTSGAHKPPG